MKFLWFHLMPYKELPDDFKEKHPSVWVDIHSSLFDPLRAHQMYNDFLDELEYAAECGYDAICCNEHHSNGYGLMPSPNLVAAALARRTSDAAICVLGNSLALYNPPTRVAEEFAMIDCISGGRLIAGFPVGTPMDTTFAYGANPSQLRERYHEAHDLVLRAWTERETFAFNGRFNQQRYVNIWPRPLQQPHPPIWIPGAGSVETWRWAAEMDYVFCYLSYYGYKMAQNVMRGFWEEMARLGKDRNPYRAGFAQVVGVAESRQRALELYTGPAEYFYGRCLHVDARFAGPPGYVTEATQRAGIESQIRMVAQGKEAGPSTNASSAQKMQSLAREMKGIVDNGYVIVGSPDEVAEQLHELARTLNIGQLMLLMQFGNMSTDVTKYNTRLFAEKVMPKLKPLFGEWENRWWPRPIDQRQRARPRTVNVASAASSAR
jgi:alkanesulfonate monooxygenase SsuD/methylene tetrahydromethanopterin reductase-like flavin-dependent oxidoreductase (luciferase family)